jgi:hypothetical protein
MPTIHVARDDGAERIGPGCRRHQSRSKALPHPRGWAASGAGGAGGAGGDSGDSGAAGAAGAGLGSCSLIGVRRVHAASPSNARRIAINRTPQFFQVSLIERLEIFGNGEDNTANGDLDAPGRGLAGTVRWPQ